MMVYWGLLTPPALGFEEKLRLYIQYREKVALTVFGWSFPKIWTGADRVGETEDKAIRDKLPDDLKQNDSAWWFVYHDNVCGHPFALPVDTNDPAIKGGDHGSFNEQIAHRVAYKCRSELPEPYRNWPVEIGWDY